MSEVRYKNGAAIAADFAGNEPAFVVDYDTGIAYTIDSAGVVHTLGMAGAGDGLNRISAGTQLAATLATVNFADSNGISFGMSNSSQITASHNALTTAALSNHSHGNPTLNLTNLSGTTDSNSAGFTLSLSAPASGLTSQSNQNVTAGNGGFAFQTLSFSNVNGISFGTSAGSAITGSHNALTSQSNQAFSADASSTFQTLTFQDSNGISFSNNAGAVRLTHGLQFTSATSAITSNAMHSTSRPAFSADASSTFQTLTFQNSNNVSFSNNAGAIRVTHNLAGTSTGFAGANVSGSMTLNSSGLNLSLSVAAPGGAAITQSIGMSTQTAGGATAGTTGYATGDDVLYHFVPGSNITMSQSINGASGTLSIYGPAAGGGATISSYENCLFVSNIAATLNGASVSHAVAFQLPQAISASFLRIPVVMTTNSTTLSTLASSMNASAQFRSTWNAVIYSLGVGASSKSLQSVASGSAGFTFQNSISVAANGTQYSVTQGYSAQVEGGGTTRTTQYSISNTNYSLTTQQIVTAFSGSRFVDIPFANSLTPGPYWLIFGYSTSSASQSARFSAATNCNVRYSNHYGASQANVNFGIMGSTNLTSGGLLGAGSFSTAGGGTTASLPISAISSSASNPRWYFQLLRSA